MGRYLEIAKRALVEFKEGPVEKIATEATSEERAVENLSVGTEWSPFEYENRSDDPYWIHAQAALDQIAAHPYLPGLWEWLEQHQPVLYRILQFHLPEEIDSLWDTRAPLDLFQQALDDSVEEHREACETFKQVMEK